MVEMEIVYEGEEGKVSTWASFTALGDNLYKVETPTYFIEEVLPGDIIEAELLDPDHLLFKRRVVKSTNQYFQFITNGKVRTSPRFDELLEMVSQEKGVWEIIFGNCVAISVPETSFITTEFLREYLEKIADEVGIPKEGEASLRTIDELRAEREAAKSDTDKQKPIIFEWE